MKILFLMSSAKIVGGTPRKTLDFITYSRNETIIYFWSNKFMEYQNKFLEAGAQVYVGDFKKNIFKHIKLLLQIIDKNNIKIIQSQFSFGELLLFLLKLLRPNMKTIVTFEGSFSPFGLKKNILNHIYKKIDYFVYISEYIQNEKQKDFNILKTKKSLIIHNGAKKREDNKDDFVAFKKNAIFDVAVLQDWKNINILINAIYIIITKYKIQNIHLYIAGDGPQRQPLERVIVEKHLSKNVHLIGYRNCIGSLLEQCDIFAHPCHVEGFGLAVAEAMHAEKPIIVSNAGALPELIENEISGIVLDPFDAEAWAVSIIKLLNSETLCNTIAQNARIRANKLFSIEKYVNSYENLYRQLLNK